MDQDSVRMVYSTLRRQRYGSVGTSRKVSRSLLWKFIETKKGGEIKSSTSVITDVPCICFSCIHVFVSLGHTQHRRKDFNSSPMVHRCHHLTYGVDFRKSSVSWGRGCRVYVCACNRFLFGSFALLFTKHQKFGINRKKELSSKVIGVSLLTPSKICDDCRERWVRVTVVTLGDLQLILVSPKEQTNKKQNGL